jgi:hypothetical protein
MKSFKDIARKSFAQKSMGKRMIGTVGLQIVQDFFEDKNLEWYIQFGTLFIKTQTCLPAGKDQEIKIKAFRYKKEILQKVNDALADYGYKRKITEIRF